MKALDDFIKENKDMFMTNEPPAGHFDRFEEKLKQMQRRNKFRFISRITSIAAIGLVMIATSIFLYSRYFDNKPVLLNLGDINPQMQKVEYYYTHQINDLSVGLDTLSIGSQESLKKMMSNELAEMDSVHRVLQKKLGSNPGDERLINAMITYYQTKLGIMKSFLNTLNQIQQSDNTRKDNHENTLL